LGGRRPVPSPLPQGARAGSPSYPWSLSKVSRRSSTAPVGQTPGVGAGEQAQAQAQGCGVGAAGPEHGAGHFFLWPPPPPPRPRPQRPAPSAPAQPPAPSPARRRPARPPKRGTLPRSPEGGTGKDGTPPPCHQCPVWTRPPYFRTIPFSFPGEIPAWSPPGLPDPQKFQTKNPAGRRGLHGRFRGFSEAPLIIAWPTPDRGFQVPRMAVSPVSFTLVPWVWEGFWADRGIDDLAQHSRGAAACHREIIYNEFGGNPRVPGGINKQLSHEYHNNII
jgi:hypothetical protein